MDKSNLLKSFNEPDEKLLFSKALDQALVCNRKHFATYSNFLDPIKASKFQTLIEKEGLVRVKAYGGAEGCERLMLGFYMEYDAIEESDFPIDAIEITANSQSLTHRDYLGSVLGLGIDRSRVGDIFVFNNKAIVFVEREVSDFVCGVLEKVGNTRVENRLVEDDFLLAPFIDAKQLDLTVSSLRLDNIISAGFRISRGKAAKLIEAEKAQINWVGTKTASKAVMQGDVVTLRGFGRMVLKSVNGNTKKGNLSISIELFSHKL